MEIKKARSCLKNFLKISEQQIKEKTKMIKKKEATKDLFDASKKTKINSEISSLTSEINQIQGRLDSVRLEILDMILANPKLISDSIIAKKHCCSYIDFAKKEGEKIYRRGLYKKYPYTIKEAMNSVFDDYKDIYVSPIQATDEDVIAAVTSKNIKIMNKTM